MFDTSNIWHEAGRSVLLLIQNAAIYAVVIGSVILAYFKLRQYMAAKKSPLKFARSNKAQGIVFGKRNGKLAYSPTADEGHCVVFGTTGCGKTSAVLIPTMRHWTGTSFSIDISGDICKNAHMPHKLVYAPGAKKTVPYDLFAPIDAMADPDDQDEALSQLAFLLMPPMTDGGAGSKFYYNGGRDILTGSLIAFYHEGMDFIDICNKIKDSSYQVLLAAIDATENIMAKRHINALAGNRPENVAECKGEADNAIKLFTTNVAVARSIHRPRKGEVAFSALSVERYNTFAFIPDAKLKLFAPLTHIITAQVLEYLSDRPDGRHPILLCLDEFVSLGKLEIVEALRKLRKKHVRIMILTQSITDIEDVYGHGAYRSMLSNFSFTLIIEVRETLTQKYFAELIGQEERERISVTRSQGLFQSKRASQTISTTKEFIEEPAKLAHLGNKLVIIHREGVERIEKAPYYKTR